MKEDHAGQGFLRAVALAAVVFLIIVAVCACSHAQNSGTVGIQAELIPVFSAANSTRSSSIFKDIGQGIQVLRYCGTNFTGSINLEWSPTGTAPFFPLVTASQTADSNCHPLSTSLYWPNMRSTVTVSSGSVSAWYSAVSGPSTFTPAAIGTNGPISPAGCDLNGVGNFAQNTTGALLNGSAGTNVYICNLVFSFAGATTTGTITISYSSSVACTGLTTLWELNITANTPQTLSFGSGLGSIIKAPTGQTVCVTTTGITSNVLISPSWAQFSQ